MVIFDDTVWQMSPGERAAVIGVLAELRPSLSIEIGSAQGAGLRQVAAYSAEVHSFDLEPPTLEPPSNVTLHTGDSHELLPEFLAELAEAGRNVDFVLVDGDHSSSGVRQDIEDLLDSPATGRTVMVIHDTANEHVRAGVDAVHYRAWPKVAYADPDWVPGRICRFPELMHEIWYGLGVVVTDASRSAYLGGSGQEGSRHGYFDPHVLEWRFEPVTPILSEMRDVIVTREAGAQAAPAPWSPDGSDEEVERLRTDLRIARQALADIQSSPSWRITAPLRAAKARARGFG